MNQIARGLAGVVLTETRLSEVDGEAGSLIVAGFPIEEIAPHASFEEVVFALWHGRLPSRAERDVLASELAEQRTLPAATDALLQAAASAKVGAMDALRMGVDSLGVAVSSLGSEPLAQAKALVARLPTVVANYWRRRHGQAPVAPDTSLGHAANYLYMLTGERPEAEPARALETYLNTVVDHGMNASTFTGRVVMSTRSDLVSALVAAIGALKGPLHGGAPGPALDMVFEIRANAVRNGTSVRDEAFAWARDVVGRNERIMGFGHRVYRVRDPRADVLAGAAERLFGRGGDPALYGDAREVEQAILAVLREAKPDRRLDTNVEFYTALLLHGVGLPTELFTPTFAIGRSGGWTAHFLEQIAEDVLIRPQSNYIGARNGSWIEIDARAA